MYSGKYTFLQTIDKFPRLSLIVPDFLQNLVYPPGFPDSTSPVYPATLIKIVEWIKGHCYSKINSEINCNTTLLFLMADDEISLEAQFFVCICATRMMAWRNYGKLQSH